MSAKERYLEAVRKNGQNGNRKLTVRPVEAIHRQCARAVLRDGKTITAALLKLGYSAKQAKKGMLTVRKSHALRTAFQEEAERLEEDAKKAPLFPIENALEGLIMSRLQKNIVKGEDKAVMSCKLAGSHKRLALWTQDAVTGIVIVNAPNVLAHPREVPEDDA